MVSWADGRNERAAVRLYTENGEFWAVVAGGRVTAKFPHPKQALDAAEKMTEAEDA